MDVHQGNSQTPALVHSLGREECPLGGLHEAAALLCTTSGVTSPVAMTFEVCVLAPRVGLLV